MSWQVVIFFVLSLDVNNSSSALGCKSERDVYLLARACAQVELTMLADGGWNVAWPHLISCILFSGSSSRVP